MDRLPNFLRFPYWPKFEPGQQMKQEPLSAAYISLKKVFLLRADDLLQTTFCYQNTKCESWPQTSDSLITLSLGTYEASQDLTSPRGFP